MKAWIVAALLACLSLPAASAQSQADQYDHIVITAGRPAGLEIGNGFAFVPYNGTVTIPVNITIGCLALAKHAAEQKVTVAFPNKPAWLTAAPITFDFTPSSGNAQQCTNGATQGRSSLNGAMTVSVSKEAPGIVLQSLLLTASMTDPTGKDPQANSTRVSLQIQFKPDYTITPAVQFPLAVTDCMAKFDVTITNRGNAHNMVMILNKTESNGVLSGIGPQEYDPASHNGTDTFVFHVQYKAPSGWTSASASFEAFSHFLVNPGYGAGDLKGEQDVKWDFVNAAPGQACAGLNENCDGTGSAPASCAATAKSPLPMLPLYVLAFVGAAIAARRRTP